MIQERNESMGKENEAAWANRKLREEFGEDITLEVLFYLADLGEETLSETFIWQDKNAEGEPYFDDAEECYHSARAYLLLKLNDKKQYMGDYGKVKAQILEDYLKNDVELCSFFVASAPELTIEETVKLFAELRKEIDRDAVIHFVEGTAVDLSNDEVQKAGDILQLLQAATVNCLVSYPETDCAPDILAFSLPASISQQQAIGYFNHALFKVASDNRTDRLNRLDRVIENMERYGCDCYGMHIHYQGDIN